MTPRSPAHVRSGNIPLYAGAETRSGVPIGALTALAGAILALIFMA